VSELDALRDALRDLLSKRSDSAAVRAAGDSEIGYDAALWRTLCEMGLAGLAIPEVFGGAGAGAEASAMACEELGRALTPSPLLGSAIVCGSLLLALDDAEVNARLLPGIASGESVAALCWSGQDGVWGDPAVELRDGRLFGTAHYVLNGDTADVLLVVASDGEEVGVYEASATSREVTPAMDATRRLATVAFDGVEARRIAGSAGPALEAARAAAQIALAAEQVGAAEAALERTVEHAKLREQFGRPIGSFQALKHRMADMYVTVTAARSTAALAAEGSLDPTTAMVACSEALQAVTAEMIQLHGGIAITWEHDAHLYFKRAHGAAHLFGTPAARMAQLARLAEVTQ